MRGAGVVVVLVCLGSVGCGGVSSSDDDDSSMADSGGGNGDAGGGSPDGAPDAGDDADAMSVPVTCEDDPVCGPAGDVGTAADIAAIAAECATWGNAEVDRFRRRTPTFLASSPISVCPEDFAPPSDCQVGKPPCYAPMLITVDPQLTGAGETAACSGAQFAAGARFRVRFNLDPPTFITSERTPHIHFERACEEECEDGEHRCEAIDGCYPDDDYCFECGFGTEAQCACLTADITVLPDCTECTYFLDDAGYFGLCLDGLCETLTEACNECPCEP